MAIISRLIFLFLFPVKEKMLMMNYFCSQTLTALRNLRQWLWVPVVTLCSVPTAGSGCAVEVCGDFVSLLTCPVRQSSQEQP